MRDRKTTQDLEETGEPGADVPVPSPEVKEEDPETHVSLIPSDQQEEPVEPREEIEERNISGTPSSSSAPADPQPVDIDDPNSIHNRLAGYDPNASNRGGGRRPPGPNGGYQSPAPLQKKEKVEKDNTPTPKVGINIGGIKKPSPPPKVETPPTSVDTEETNKAGVQEGSNEAVGVDEKEHGKGGSPAQQNQGSGQEGESKNAEMPRVKFPTQGTGHQSDKNTRQTTQQRPDQQSSKEERPKHHREQQRPQSSQGQQGTEQSTKTEKQQPLQHQNNQRARDAVGQQRGNGQPSEKSQTQSAHSVKKANPAKDESGSRTMSNGKAENNKRPHTSTQTGVNAQKPNPASPSQREGNVSGDTQAHRTVTGKDRNIQTPDAHVSQEVLETLKSFKDLSSAIATQTRDMSKGMLETAQLSVDKIAGQSDKATEVLIQGVQVIAESVNVAVETLAESMNETAETLARGAEAASYTMIDGAKESASRLNRETEHTTSQLVRVTEQASETLVKGSKEATDVLVHGVRETTQSLLDTTQGVADTLIQGTQDVTESLSDSVRDTSKQMTTIAQEATQQIATQAMESSALMAKSVENAISKLSDSTQHNHADVVSLTREATQELANEMKSSAERLLSATETAIREITEAAKVNVENQKTVTHASVDTSYLEKQVSFLQSQLQSLQSQMFQMSREKSSALLPSQNELREESDIPPHVPAPDSFFDPIIDYTAHTPSYDPTVVADILLDVANAAESAMEVYKVVETAYGGWTPDPQLLANIKLELIQNHSHLMKPNWGNPALEEEARTQILSTVSVKCKGLSEEEENVVGRILIAEVLGIGKLDPLMEDRSVTEILVIGPNKVFCIVDGNQMLTDVTFDSSKELNGLAVSMASAVGKAVNDDTPHCDAKLQNGARVHIIIPPASANGHSIITIRKPPSTTKPVDIAKLVESQALSVKMVEFLKMCVKGKANIILYGETNSGKTTVTRAMSGFFSPHDRIISIEDTQELNLPNFHYVPLEAVKRDNKDKNIGIHELFKDVLRMSPDRLLVGEVRGAEGGDMIEAMQSGQRGGITTLHAGAPEQVVMRLVIMMARANFGLPEEIMRRMIHDSIDLVIQCRILPDKTRKITRITEVIPVDEARRLGIVPFRDIFKFDQTDLEEDEFGRTKKVFGSHQYKNHLSLDKRTRFFEFGARVPTEFGGLHS